MIKFASILYVFFFLILVSLFYAIIHFYGAQSNLTLFYVRRFLIQPILWSYSYPLFKKAEQVILRII
jgi:exosortase F-associated protein